MRSFGARRDNLQEAESLYRRALSIDEDGFGPGPPEGCHSPEQLGDFAKRHGAIGRTTMGELAASIAHEVNQPLSGMVTNANAGLRWLAGDSPNVAEAREAIRRIVRDGNRASDVISHMRALFKKAPAAKEPVDINEVVQEVLWPKANCKRMASVYGPNSPMICQS